MALNEIYKDGNELVLPVAEATNSGDLVQVGALVGLAQKDAWQGEDGNWYTTVKLNGVVKVATAGTFAAGDAAYFDGSDVTDVNTDKFIGHVVAVDGSNVFVRLVQGA